MIATKRNGVTLDHKEFVFPAGEVGVKFPLTNSVAYTAKTGFFSRADSQVIIANITSSKDVIELVMVVDALRRIDKTPINLFMPYVPYGRQDRVCDVGESFSLKAFAGIINSLNFNEVHVVDPHSHVTGAVFDNIKVTNQFDIVSKWIDFINMVSEDGKNTRFVSPDAGANKKTSEIAGFFNHEDFVRADKLRDLTNGNIKETIVYADDLKGKTIICCDDICDGGRTFIELAKVCKAKGAEKFVLFVTHGVFSKGMGALVEGGVDKIWTTDSFDQGIYSLPDYNAYVFNLEQQLGI